MDFIVSGNIDRFVIRRGMVRFMKHEYHWPVLPTAHSGLTAGKLKLFRGRKIVVAGMSRRLEAALDERGLALGVQVYAGELKVVGDTNSVGVVSPPRVTYELLCRAHWHEGLRAEEGQQLELLDPKADRAASITPLHR